ncbi:MAG TPA: SsrA-binding protein SmpB [Acholeplasmataceae bacterium]|jgi:SsrA-binding protein|nr:SsrA-binding protein SmpB [Acholeplasmataceae bacterium]
MEQINVVARNKKATHDYFILEKFECGIVLTGTEIKSIRAGKVSIQDAYCNIKNDELYIINMHIAKYEQGNIFNHQETRNRKLLAHRREIRKMFGKITQEGLTIIPLQVYIKNGLAKIEVAICKGKKKYDKREDLRREAVKRDISRAMKNRW